MHSGFAHWARGSGLAAALVFAAAAPAAAATPRHDAVLPSYGSPSTFAPADALVITESDVAASNGKIKMAYDALVTMWSKRFADLGAVFDAPGLLRYRGMVRTSCGVMPSDNALYCPARNAIYFDEVFVAKQAKAAANELGTDGDMVAVGIIAHEMGHAVAAQLGATGRVPYEDEATADCLAGAFTQQSAQNGELEKGDLEEAFFGMAAAGDPPTQLTGDRRIDARLTVRAAMLGHGTREQRMGNFKAGYDGGPRACLAAFR